MGSSLSSWPATKGQGWTIPLWLAAGERLCTPRVLLRTWGPLLFVTMINDLKPSGWTHKFMDDTTLSECIKPFEQIVWRKKLTTDFLNNWFVHVDSNMILNQTRTKEMLISFRKADMQPDAIQFLSMAMPWRGSLTGGMDIKWLNLDTPHRYHYKKASNRLFLLTHLGQGSDKMTCSTTTCTPR